MIRVRVMKKCGKLFPKGQGFQAGLLRRSVDAPVDIDADFVNVVFHCVADAGGFWPGRRRVIKIEHEYASLVCEIDGKSRGIFPPALPKRERYDTIIPSIRGSARVFPGKQPVLRRIPYYRILAFDT